MNNTSTIQLEHLTRKMGNFLVWVKDEEGKKYIGNSFDLCLSFANGNESNRVFPCYDAEGNFYQLHPSKIKNFGGDYSW